MDQLKEVLRQVVKYRFWIVVGIAALLPIIAYFIAVPGLNKAEADEASKITAAYKDVQQYASSPINGQFSQAVKSRNEVLDKDVNAAWRKLYQTQAPLLTWPDVVADRMAEWGRKWPEGHDPQEVNSVIERYTAVYPNYVDRLYKTLKPFNPEDGTGIVAAPPKEYLLAPMTFSEDNLPTLGRVWAAQERLWVQRTVLDVIARVNEKVKAKNWDGAAIKQLVDLQVATSAAQDQKSLAKGETLTVAPDILPPGAAEAAKAAEGSTSTGINSGSTAAFGGMMMGGGGSAAPETVEYIDSEQSYKVPILLTVLIEQDKIPELFAEIQNSPMSIQVLDFEFRKPSKPVTKPQKGEEIAGFGGGFGGMMGRFGGSMMAGGENMLSAFSRGSGNPYGGRGSMLGSGEAYGGAAGGDPGAMFSGAAGGAAAKKGRAGGVNVKDRNIQASKDKEAAKKKGVDKKSEEEETQAKADPYYYVVQVTLSAQARFYKTPPAAEPAQSETAADAAKAEDATAAAKPAEPPAQPAADAAKDNAETKKENAKPDDMPKEDAKPEEAKQDEPKSDAAKPDEAKKDQTKDAESKQGDEPAKEDTPKNDAPKDNPEAPASNPKR